MKQEEKNTVVIVDDTTIYEVDLLCYECMSKEAKRKCFCKEELQKIEKSSKKESPRF